MALTAAITRWFATNTDANDERSNVATTATNKQLQFNSDVLLNANEKLQIKKRKIIKVYQSIKFLMSIFIWSVTEYKNTKYSSLDNMSLYRYWLTQNDPHSRPKFKNFLHLGLH